MGLVMHLLVVFSILLMGSCQNIVAVVARKDSSGEITMEKVDVKALIVDTNGAGDAFVGCILHTADGFLPKHCCSCGQKGFFR